MEAVFLYIFGFVGTMIGRGSPGDSPRKRYSEAHQIFTAVCFVKKESPISSQLEQIAGKVFQGLYPCLLAMSLCRILLWLREIRF